MATPSRSTQSGLSVIVYTMLPQAYQLIMEWAAVHGHRISLVVTTPGPATMRNQSYLGVLASAPPEQEVIVTPDNRGLVGVISGHKPDLIVVYGYPFRIPSAVFSIPRLGTVNLHPTPLPAYRGPNPERMIYEGHTVLGATLHRMEKEFDSGLILSTRTCPMPTDLRAEDVQAAWQGIIRETLHDGLNKAVAGEAGQPQDHASASYAAPFQPHEHWLDWNLPQRVIQARTVGLNLYKIQTKALIGDRTVFVERATPRLDRATTAAPGTVLSVDGAVYTIAVADGLVEVVASSPVPEEELPAWARQQEERTSRLPLPYDGPRAGSSYLAGRHPFALAPELTQRLQALSASHGARLPIALLAAFKALLLRYTGQDDLWVGTTVTGAHDLQVIRTDLSGDPTFVQVLTRLSKSVADRSSQDVLPPAGVAAAWRKQHRTADTVRMHAMLVMPADDAPVANEPAMAHWLETARAEEVDLALLLRPTQDGVAGELVYNASCCAEATMVRLVNHFQTLLAGAVAAPEEAVSHLPLMTVAERQHLLVEWNATQTEYPRDATVHQLFAAQAQRTPDAVALVFGEQRLTYGELDRRANQLGHHLRRLGVGPNTLVGLSVERSLEMIVGVLGILKAGGAYVPLDPTYPAERLAYMLADTQVPVLLTQEQIAPTLPAHRARLICLDTDWPEIAQESDVDPAVETTPDHLIYIMYTSGSTGKPKGVSVPHRGVVRLVQGTTYAQFGPDEVFLQLSPVAFDASTLEIWGALLNGARLVIMPPQTAAVLQDLGKVLVEHRVTTLWLTAGLFHLMVDEHLHDLRHVRQLLAGGDVLSVPRVRAVLDALPNLRLINGYGPTENTTFTCCYTVPQDWQGESLPIGRPIANTQVYILDAHRRPVPVGVPGELYVGGDGLARGYFNRPELTAERFVPNPFSQEQDARLYRTGDLVRYRADGTIEFLGRTDNQVKIRGFRIELGEVEAAIQGHSGVKDALVVVRITESGDKRLAAYVIPAETDPVSAAQLRAYLEQKLPSYMVPTSFTLVSSWPLNANGKIDRRALPEPAEPVQTAAPALPVGELEQQIAATWQQVLNLNAVGLDDNFFELGGHSLAIARVESRLNQIPGVKVSTTDLFRFPTIRALVAFLNQGQAPVKPAAAPRPTPLAPPMAQTAAPQTAAPQTAAPQTAAPEHLDGFAIVGMAGRFPGSRDVAEFWQNLVEGVETIRDLTDDELLAAGVDPALLADPAYVKRSGMLDDIDRFDASFFGFTPREAEILDPQQRLFLETAQHALDHAGYSGAGYAGRIGLFAGAGKNSYTLDRLAIRPQTAGEAFEAEILNDREFLATRAAYKLNLRGPAYTVNTACSTSLVAVHLACQSLRTGECDMALAGGVSIEVPHGVGYVYREGHILSPDGYCRAFDAEAHGTIRGSGVGAVVLKRLADAVADGDMIWAVVRGSATNNDGAMRVGYSAPSVDGQAEVVAQALASAGVDPRTIGYVEAHGTGTPLGDPIEVAALTQAYRVSTDESGFCGIGSVKTNIGHLDAAAGVTGLIKAALSLHHQLIPPTLHFQSPNPKLELENTPFHVVDQLTPWPAGPAPRRAAVSSFGVGGTNAHVVLEEAPALPTPAARPAHHALLLSAKTPAALSAMSLELAQHLQSHPELNLADVAHTLQTGRATLPHRRLVVCLEPAEAVAALLEPAGVRTFTGSPQANRGIVFVFPGQGLQQVNMGRPFYEAYPVFRETVDQCAAQLQPHLGFDLRAILYPSKEQEAWAAGELNRTLVTQPAIFVVEYALAQLLLSWGIRPQAMIGHSLGEYVAACVAGVLSLADALRLVAARGAMVQDLPGGAMLAVGLAPEAVRPLLGDALDLAVINGEQACVVAGGEEAVEALRRRLQEQEVPCQRVRTSHAFHSRMLDPMLDEFRALVRSFTLRPPQIPYITNVTGTWVTAAQATDSDHWVQHLRGTVQFAQGLATLLQEPGRIYLEVGPGQAFSSILRRHAQRDHMVLAAATMASSQQPSDTQALLTALGRLWIAGVAFDWQAPSAGSMPRRVALPGYPFERKRYWLQPRAPLAAGPDRQPYENAAPEQWPVYLQNEEPGADVYRESFVAPRDETELELVKIFEQVLGVSPVGVTHSFFDLGGTSLSALALVAAIERVFGRRVRSDDVFSGQTVEALAKALRAERFTHNELVGIQTSGTLPPLFCVHPYFGHATGYYQLARCLGPDQPVYGIQARGLHGEAQPHTRIADMALDYIRLIKAKQPEGPYFLVGHSMGGNIVYEMARQLRVSGDQIALLALLDTKANNPAPQPMYRTPAYGAITPEEWLSEEAAVLGLLFGRLQLNQDELRAVPRDQQWLHVLQAAITAGLLPPGVAPEQMTNVITVSKADDEALRSWTPEPYDGSVLLFVAEEGLAKAFAEPSLGWMPDLIGGELRVVGVPGDHQTLLEQPNVEVIAAELRAALASIHRRSRTYWAARLRSLSGRPARVITADGKAQLGVYQYAPDGGTVTGVALPELPDGAVVVEVITAEGVLRFNSESRGRKPGAGEVPVAIPDEVEVIARSPGERAEVGGPGAYIAQSAGR